MEMDWKETSGRGGTNNGHGFHIKKLLYVFDLIDILMENAKHSPRGYV